MKAIFAFLLFLILAISFADTAYERLTLSIVDSPSIGEVSAGSSGKPSGNNDTYFDSDHGFSCGKTEIIPGEKFMRVKLGGVNLPFFTNDESYFAFFMNRNYDSLDEQTRESVYGDDYFYQHRLSKVYGGIAKAKEFYVRTAYYGRFHLSQDTIYFKKEGTDCYYWFSLYAAPEINYFINGAQRGDIGGYSIFLNKSEQNNTFYSITEYANASNRNLGFENHFGIRLVGNSKSKPGFYFESWKSSGTGRLEYFELETGNPYIQNERNVSAGFTSREGTIFRSFKPDEIAFDFLLKSNASSPSPLPKPDYIQNVSMKKGWNMISTGASITFGLFMNQSTCKPKGTLWGYSPESGAYYKPFLLEAGHGYWLNVENDCQAEVKAMKPIVISVHRNGSFMQIDDFNATYEGKDRVELKTGWNLIGAPEKQTDFSSISGTCNKDSFLYYYDGLQGAYVKTKTLKPGSGYLVNLREPCNLSVSYEYG